MAISDDNMAVICMILYKTVTVSFRLEYLLNDEMIVILGTVILAYNIA